MGRILVLALFVYASAVAADQSTCYGTTANGRLENGVKLPAEGENFVGYSVLAATLGRTYLHATARDIVLDAYKSLEQSAPGKLFKYAETGFAEGGRFKPHKTHQNGLSIDFMVPVVNAQGESVHLSTHPFNKFGYNIEFDSRGNYDGLTIDYEAMAAHLIALEQAAARHQAKLWRVIFDPALQPYLLATRHGDTLKERVTFSTKASWVRHDEHYHVDIALPCKRL
jgi:penicillin-insensitive murein endopeptidase